MTDTREWHWMVGVLHGIGECIWEESSNRIRKVSRIIMDDQGRVGMMKGLVGGALVGCGEINADNLVAFSMGATDEMQKNATQLWSNIIPVNGSRFKDL